MCDITHLNNYIFNHKPVLTQWLHNYKKKFKKLSLNCVFLKVSFLKTYCFEGKKSNTCILH